ncbi:MAG: tocopherol cyclase family protein [Candidatus Thorarchaeota archaeon]
MRSWRVINHPNSFQGNLKKKNYFEGWYNKIVSGDEKSIFAFIPTIALNKDYSTSHCAIQFFDGSAGRVEYFKYDLSEFENLSELNYKIRIGNSVFSENGMNLDIDRNGSKIKGFLRYTNLIRWERNILQPGVMGIISYFPMMETYHGIVSMNHTVDGILRINGDKNVFDNGRGYIEKDWGSSFPSSWIWMHSNHFSNRNLSFTFSIAKIPFLNLKLNGFLCIIWNQGRFYKFTSYSGAKILKLDIDSTVVKFIIRDKRYILMAKAIKGSSFDLRAPKLGIMEGHCIESMTSKIKIKLLEVDKNPDKYNLIISDFGRNAGLEIMDKNELA